jgi:hypothetical protein
MPVQNQGIKTFPSKRSAKVKPFVEKQSITLREKQLTRAKRTCTTVSLT